MSENTQKSNSCSANQEAVLTIYDYPNICCEIIAKCQSLAKHSDPEVVKLANEIHADAKRMLDSIGVAVDQILAVEAYWRERR